MNSILSKSTLGCALRDLLLASVVLPGHAALVHTWIGSQAVPDNDPNGVAFLFQIDDPPSAMSRVTVSLQLSGGYNGDLYAFLTHGTGFAVLLNRVGRGWATSADGYSDPGLSVTFDSHVTDDIHRYQDLDPSFDSEGQITGVWGADGRRIDPTSDEATFQTASRTSQLDVFHSQNSSGNWTRFVSDLSSGGVTTLSGWSVMVPEPVHAAAVAGAALALASSCRRRRRSRLPPRPD
jgi:subtilisin-like proprotein convertase family protein